VCVHCGCRQLQVGMASRETDQYLGSLPSRVGIADTPAVRAKPMRLHESALLLWCRRPPRNGQPVVLKVSRILSFLIINNAYVRQLVQSFFMVHRMHVTRTVAMNDHMAWATVICLSRGFMRLHYSKRLNGSRSCLDRRLLGPKKHKAEVDLPAQFRCDLRQITLATCLF